MRLRDSNSVAECGALGLSVMAGVRLCAHCAPAALAGAASGAAPSAAGACAARRVRRRIMRAVAAESNGSSAERQERSCAAREQCASE